RSVREDAPQSERRPAAARGAVEVRLQGDQVNRQDPPDPGEASHDLESRLAARVRLLRERQPGCEPPSLEPGDGAADRRVPPPPDLAVQRLRRSGGPLV